METETEPKWYTVAKAEAAANVHEIAGPAANPRIVDYFKATTFHATSDEVPWCSAAINFYMREAGIAGTGSAAAHSWTTWGNACPPKLGCVVVIQRRDLGPDHGYHVALFVSLDFQRIELLGGNQNNSV